MSNSFGLTTWLWLMLAGACGATARYGLSRWVHSLSFGKIGLLALENGPVSTLLVNLVGCFLFGILASLLSGRFPNQEGLKVALLVGFIGAFTTFSTYIQDGWLLSRSHQWFGLGLYLLLSNMTGFLLLWLGHQLGKLLAQHWPFP
ncbi:MAG: CrcB family protein [Candidatus Melainabacteria bacterium]|nr:CrcB family protein [Candidatus Melainabacteria bacterium]